MSNKNTLSQSYGHHRNERNTTNISNFPECPESPEEYSPETNRVSDQWKLKEKRRKMRKEIFGEHYNYEYRKPNPLKMHRIQENRNTEIERSNRILLEKIQNIFKRSKGPKPRRNKLVSEPELSPESNQKRPPCNSSTQMNMNDFVMQKLALKRETARYQNPESKERQKIVPFLNYVQTTRNSSVKSTIKNELKYSIRNERSAVHELKVNELKSKENGKMTEIKVKENGKLPELNSRGQLSVMTPKQKHSCSFTHSYNTPLQREQLGRITLYKNWEVKISQGKYTVTSYVCKGKYYLEISPIKSRVRMLSDLGFLTNENDESSLRISIDTSEEKAGHEESKDDPKIFKFEIPFSEYQKLYQGPFKEDHGAICKILRVNQNGEIELESPWPQEKEQEEENNGLFGGEQKEMKTIEKRENTRIIDVEKVLEIGSHRGHPNKDENKSLKKSHETQTENPLVNPHPENDVRFSKDSRNSKNSENFKEHRETVSLEVNTFQKNKETENPQQFHKNTLEH